MSSSRQRVLPELQEKSEMLWCGKQEVKFPMDGWLMHAIQKILALARDIHPFCLQLAVWLTCQTSYIYSVIASCAATQMHAPPAKIVVALSIWTNLSAFIISPPLLSSPRKWSPLSHTSFFFFFLAVNTRILSPHLSSNNFCWKKEEIMKMYLFPLPTNSSLNAILNG